MDCTKEKTDLNHLALVLDPKQNIAYRRVATDLISSSDLEYYIATYSPYGMIVIHSSHPFRLQPNSFGVPKQCYDGNVGVPNQSCGA